MPNTLIGSNEQKIFFFDEMNADLWGLVLGFALRLDLLDRACLADVRNFARVCKALSLAVWRLDKTALRLRVRVHRLFGFRSPNKTQLKVLLPRFAESLPPGASSLTLAQVSDRVAKSPQGAAWVSWAEERPARIASGKRKQDQSEDKRVQRQRFIEAELAQRGLPCDHTSSSVLCFIGGATKTPEAVFKAMELHKGKLAVLAFVEARDALANPATRLADIARLAERHGVALPQDLPPLPRSPARLVATLWLRQVKSPGVAFELERKLLVRAGKDLMEKPQALDDLDLEASLWLRAARGLVTRLDNYNARR
jgi:hypothetical protein